MRIQQFKNSPGSWEVTEVITELLPTHCAKKENKIQIVSPSQALSVQSKVHTKTKATGRASSSGQTRVQKGAFFKSLQSHLVEIRKSNLSSTKLDLSVEIYQSWYSDEGRVTLPPHAVPRDEACVCLYKTLLLEKPFSETRGSLRLWETGCWHPGCLWWPCG